MKDSGKNKRIFVFTHYKNTLSLNFDITRSANPILKPDGYLLNLTVTAFLCASSCSFSAMISIVGPSNSNPSRVIS